MAHESPLQAVLGNYRYDPDMLAATLASFPDIGSGINQHYLQQKLIFWCQDYIILINGASYEDAEQTLSAIGIICKHIESFKFPVSTHDVTMNIIDFAITVFPESITDGNRARLVQTLIDGSKDKDITPCVSEPENLMLKKILEGEARTWTSRHQPVTPSPTR